MGVVRSNVAGAYSIEAISEEPWTNSEMPKFGDAVSCILLALCSMVREAFSPWDWVLPACTFACKCATNVNPRFNPDV